MAYCVKLVSLTVRPHAACFRAAACAEGRVIHCAALPSTRNISSRQLELTRSGLKTIGKSTPWRTSLKILIIREDCSEKNDHEGWQLVKRTIRRNPNKSKQFPFVLARKSLEIRTPEKFSEKNDHRGQQTQPRCRKALAAPWPHG